MQLLDILVSGAVEEPPRTAPPAAPAIGSCYIVADAPSGPWSGQANTIAAFTIGGWRFVSPAEGCCTFIRSNGLTAMFRNGQWALGSVSAARIIVEDQQVVGGRGSAVAIPAGGSVIDVQARAAISEIVARLRDHGLIA